MLILTIRTDKPESEIALFENDERVHEIKWQAHRQLAETLHQKIQELLDAKAWQAIEGVVVFKGPGSYTGLRIGVSVANALAAGLKIPVVGSSNQTWQASGIKQLLEGKNDTQVLPEYGAPVFTTQPRK